MSEAADFYDPWAGLYDVMVDWDRRLAREGPALVGLLKSAGAGKVLDVACGTGRHLAYLRDAGFEVAGADASAEMIARAARLLQGPVLVQWSMADPPVDRLRESAPFDAIVCLGNSFPHVLADAAVAAALANFKSLLGPGGLLVLGLKALALLKGARLPFLPLVRREEGGRQLLFVRFYEFATSGPVDVADFHLVILGPGLGKAGGSLGAAPPGGTGGIHHAVTQLRAWRPDELGEAIRAAGFADVRIGPDLASLGVAADFDVSGAQTRARAGDGGEDIFVIARRGG